MLKKVIALIVSIAALIAMSWLATKYEFLSKYLWIFIGLSGALALYLIICMILDIKNQNKGGKE